MLAKLSVRVSVGLNACASARLAAAAAATASEAWPGRVGGASGAERRGRGERSGGGGAHEKAAELLEERRGKAAARRGREARRRADRTGVWGAEWRRGGAEQRATTATTAWAWAAVRPCRPVSVRRPTGEADTARAAPGMKAAAGPWEARGRGGVNTAGCCPVGSWRQSGRPRRGRRRPSSGRASAEAVRKWRPTP